MTSDQQRKVKPLGRPAVETDTRLTAEALGAVATEVLKADAQAPP